VSLSNSSAGATLLKGVEILDAIMNQHGFEFVPGAAGRSSGGEFANGTYRKSDRTVEIHFRRKLGLVTYHVGTDSLRHELYMRALLGKAGGSRYPGFSDDPLDGFRELRSDLQNYCSDFLAGSGKKFRQCAADARRAKQLSPLKRLDAGWPSCITEMR
jgi:hypothetical protein